jgi:hypothetical protein
MTAICLPPIHIHTRTCDRGHILGAQLFAPSSVAEKTWEDPHPLVPVFIAGAISLVLSVTFIGSILAWLALRHSGVMAP